MDTNVVVPVGPGQCSVLFDWWLEACKAGETSEISDSLQASDQARPKTRF